MIESSRGRLEVGSGKQGRAPAVTLACGRTQTPGRRVGYCAPMHRGYMQRAGALAITVAVLTVGCTKGKAPVAGATDPPSPGTTSAADTPAPTTTATGSSPSDVSPGAVSTSPATRSTGGSTPSSTPVPNSTPDPSGSGTASPSNGGSNGVPAIPATGAVKRQLEAAARNYYLTLERAYATMDERPLAALRTATCTCQKVEAAIRQARSGGYHVGLTYEILSASANDAANGIGEVTLSYNTSATVVTDATGKEISRTRPVRLGIKEMSFALRGGRWLVSNVNSYK